MSTVTVTVTATGSWQSGCLDGGPGTSIKVGPIVGEVTRSGDVWEWSVCTDAWSGGFCEIGEAATKEAAIEAAEASIRKAFGN